MTESIVSEGGQSEVRSDSTGDPSPAESSPHRLDTVFDVLRNERRRQVLRYLREHESTTRGELAEHVAAVENGVSRESVTSTQRKRLYVSLYQAHLPKLDAAGAVEYDPDRGTVERAPGTDEFLTYLDATDGTADEPSGSQSRHTLGGGALLATALLGTLLLGPGVGVDAVFGVALLLVGFACGLVVRGYAA